MAKSDSDLFTTIFALLMGIFFLYAGFKMPLKETSHRKFTGEISHIETRDETGRRKTPHRVFRLKREKNYLKDRLFSNLHIVGKNIKSQKINDLLIVGQQVSFHVEKSELDEYQVYIYSLEVDGKVIVPLRTKSRLKIEYLFFGLLLLFGFYFFVMDD